MAESDVRLSQSMKYTALYWAMRFYEREEDVFVKAYDDGTEIKIDSMNQLVFVNGDEALRLDTHVSFVKLECINRILSMGYGLCDLELTDKIDELVFKGYRITFYIWGDALPKTGLAEKTCVYKSRLVSGVLEYKCKIQNGDLYDYGLFEKKTDVLIFTKRIQRSYYAPDFVIEENKLIRYIGHDKKVVVPEGIEELESSAFWDNHFIEEVVLPESLVCMGGDTFYCCDNLRKVNIPASVEVIANNPFAGCPLLEITNNSKHFVYENGALYTADKTTLIYCSINGNKSEFAVPEGVTVIGKHSFFRCDRLETVILPSTLKKMENNPFSGCAKLSLINHSKSYVVKDDVIYNEYMSQVIGALNKIKTERLEIAEGVRSINRNAFWNCKGIETIVLPESLEDIGYNPFVGCSKMHFVSKSPNFKVVDGVLYSKDMNILICYPAWKAVGEVHIPDCVTALERGAFSGCERMTDINLHNVNLISKSCFTNCMSLERVYCSDLINYIGEWAFGHCRSLKEVSVKEGTVIDNNAFSNCNAELVIRHTNCNYLIESDNLYTLKSMQYAYKGKIDSILIDPPYNSHVDYIGYKDDNYEDSYLNFMEERISLSYNLLSDKGFMVINIDDGEIDNLVFLCRKYFANGQVEVCKWKKKHPFFDANRVVLNPNKVQTDYENIIICKKSAASIFKKIKQPYIENGKLLEKEEDVPTVWDCFGTTSSAKDEIKEIFGSRDFFSTPKPLKLMKELIRATTEKESIVMDYFAGSGTVGHACMDLNNEDGGIRTFILVCNNESDICAKVAKIRLDKFTSDLSFEYKFLK